MQKELKGMIKLDQRPKLIKNRQFVIIYVTSKLTDIANIMLKIIRLKWAYPHKPFKKRFDPRMKGASLACGCVCVCII